MAEGLARAGAPDGWKVYSAGSHPGSVHPLAIEAMRERGIDIRQHRAKGLDDVPLADADVVVTLCTEEECPVTYTSARRLHWPLPDPAAATARERRAELRTVRDEIAARLEQFWDAERSEQ